MLSAALDIVGNADINRIIPYFPPGCSGSRRHYHVVSNRSDSTIKAAFKCCLVVNRTFDITKM